MKTVKMSEAPAQLPEMVEGCRFRGESFLLTDYGKPAAKLVPVGGPETHEAIKDTAGPVSGKGSRIGAVADSGTAENIAAGSMPNRKRGRAKTR